MAPSPKSINEMVNAVEVGLPLNKLYVVSKDNGSHEGE